MRTHKVADYLLWLWEVKKLSVSSIKAYRSMVSAVFRFKLLELSDHHVLWDLICSFAIEHPRRLQVPPPWDLDVVLRHLMSEAFEPIVSLSLRSLTKKALFLVALATAKRVGELQALSHIVSSVRNDLVVSYLPHFVAKTERADALLPRSFHVRSLRDFAGNLEAGSLLCPVRALRAYSERTRSVFARASYLFVSPRSPSRPISKNAVSYTLREVISDAGAVRGDKGSLKVEFSFCLFTFVIFNICLKGCGPLVRSPLWVLLLIPSNLRAFFGGEGRGSGVFAFLSGIRILGTRLGSIHSSGVGSVPAV